MVLGNIIFFVCFSRSPIYVKLSSLDLVFDPVKTHVNRFGAFLLDFFIIDATCCRIIGIDRCG